MYQFEESFKIFNKHRSSKFSIENTTIIILVLIIFTLYIIEKIFEKNNILDIFFVYTVFGIIFSILFFSISSLFRYEKLNGYFEGNLVFSKKYIKINNTKHKIEDIYQIEIYNNSIKGKFLINSSKLEPKLSNGTDNYLKIILKENYKEIIVFYLQTKDSLIKSQKEEFISYYYSNILSWNNLKMIVDTKKENLEQKF